MAILTVTYKDSTIAELISPALKTFYTSSKYCEDDITLNYNKTSYEENAFIDRTISTCTNNTKIIGPAAFTSCSRLTTVNFPECTTIGSSAFSYCSSLTTISFPKCTTIGSGAFYYCAFTTVSFPECTTIYNTAFQNCQKLTTVSFPKCTTIINDAFALCYRLSTVSFPECTTIYNTVFGSCSRLTTASFPKCTTIGSSAFRKCVRLTSLYLTNSSVATLANSNAFTSTPIDGYSASAGTFGSIYVPASLLASYKAATNWTYFSSRFVGI